MDRLTNRNQYFFGLGTVGRDMFYSFVANTMLYFLSDVLSLPLWVFAATSMTLSVLRVLDAINDPHHRPDYRQYPFALGQVQACHSGGRRAQRGRLPDAVLRYRDGTRVYRAVCRVLLCVGYHLRHQ